MPLFLFLMEVILSSQESKTNGHTHAHVHTCWISVTYLSWELSGFENNTGARQ